MLQLLPALQAQRLALPHIRLDGRVEVSLQKEPRIDPHAPVFASDYDEEWIVYDCQDTLVTTLDFSSPVYGIAHEEEADVVCEERVDLHYPYFFCNLEWMNTCDLLPLIHLQHGFMFWQNWESDTIILTGSEHVYLCGNDETGHWETEDQCWILNENAQVSEVIQFRPDKSVMARYNLSYNAGQKIESITRTDYNPYDSTLADVASRTWFYDQNGRDRMVIAHAGLPGKYADEELEAFASFLKKSSITGSASETAYFDSLGVTELIVYENSVFGPETIHGFYNNDVYSTGQKFLCDSIYYDDLGRIIRYSGSKNWDGALCEFNYYYGNESPGLVRAEGREHNECGDRGCTDGHVFQEFTYEGDRLETIQEIHYEIHYPQNESGIHTPVEVLREERIYSLKFTMAAR